MTITDSQTATVQGVSTSSDANDVQLVAKLQRNQQKTLAQQNATVVSVTLAINALNGKSPSEGNPKGKNFLNYIESNASPNGPSGSAVPNGPLGEVIAKGQTSDYCAIGVETVGQVNPSTYTGLVTITKGMSGVAVQGSSNNPLKTLSGDDTNPIPQLFSNDPTASTPKGFIYDLDLPGPNPLTPPYRTRINFTAYATLGDGSDRSKSNGSPKKGKQLASLTYYVAASCTNDTNPNNIYPIFSNDVTGDNQAGTLGPIKTTWNLK